MKKIGKIVLGGGCLMTIICIALMLICNQIVVNNAEGKVYYDIDRIKYNKVGLLLGTTPQARFDRITNYFFIYRIDAAEQLYKARKIDQILGWQGVQDDLLCDQCEQGVWAEEFYHHIAEVPQRARHLSGRTSWAECREHSGI